MGVKNLKIFCGVKKFKKFEQWLFMSNRQLFTQYNTELALLPQKEVPSTQSISPLIFHLKNPTNQNWAFFILKNFLGSFTSLGGTVGQVCYGLSKPASVYLRACCVNFTMHSLEKCSSFNFAYSLVLFRLFFTLYLQN